MEEKLAFVGSLIGKLYIAKLNRGIYLNIINPTLNWEEMKNTALQIANIYNKSFSNNISEIIVKLFESIFNYNNYWKNKKCWTNIFSWNKRFYN